MDSGGAGCAIVFAGLGLVLACSAAAEPQAVPREKVIPAREHTLLFTQDPVKAGVTDRVWSLAEDEMAPQDKAEAANSQAAVGERAAFLGLGFDRGQWTYEQIVCPALPNHLFLKYTRSNGADDVSVFSASVPRGGEGRVRIIPIQMRGYSLFSPAPVNALTMSAFNRIRAEERASGGDDAPDWLGTALCYAALAGAGRIGGGPAQGSTAKAESVSTAAMELEPAGGATLSFSDASPRPMEWTMVFDRRGTLLKARHERADLIAVRKLNPKPVDEKGRAIP